MALLTSLTNSSGVTQELDQASATAIHTLGDVYYDGSDKYQYAIASEDLSAGAILTRTAVTGVDTVEDGAGTATYDGKQYALLAQIVKAAAFGSAGDYKNYKGIVDDGTGVGQVFVVDNNSAGVLYLKEPLTTALNVADSDISLFLSDSVREVDASTDEPVVGVSRQAIDQSVAAYFWMQVAGDAPVLCGADSSGSAGIYAVTGDDTAGSCAIAAATTGLEDANIVGTIIIGTDTADTHIWVKLSIQ